MSISLLSVFIILEIYTYCEMENIAEAILLFLRICRVNGKSKRPTVPPRISVCSRNVTERRTGESFCEPRGCIIPGSPFLMLLCLRYTYNFRIVLVLKFAYMQIKKYIRTISIWLN